MFSGGTRRSEDSTSPATATRPRNSPDKFDEVEDADCLRAWMTRRGGCFRLAHGKFFKTDEQQCLDLTFECLVPTMPMGAPARVAATYQPIPNRNAELLLQLKRKRTDEDLRRVRRWIRDCRVENGGSAENDWKRRAVIESPIGEELLHVSGCNSTCRLVDHVGKKPEHLASQSLTQHCGSKA